MQLKIQRSQRDCGVISKTAIFCIDARVEFTAEEKSCIRRYKLGREVIYDSQARTAMMERSAAARDASGHPINYRGGVGTMIGGAALGAAAGALSAAKSLGLAAVAATMLRITIDSLEQGQHVECKSLDELLATEDAIMAACQNLRTYLDTAATFDGREVLFRFDRGEPEPVAVVASPAPALLVTPTTVPAAAAMISFPPAATEQPPAQVADETSDPADWEAPPTDEPGRYASNPFGYGGDDETRKMLIAGGVALGVVLILGFMPGPFLLRVIVLGAVLFGGYKYYRNQA